MWIFLKYTFCIIIIIFYLALWITKEHIRKMFFKIENLRLIFYQYKLYYNCVNNLQFSYASQGHI